MRSYQQKRWQLLAAGVLMSVCTSCFTVSPVWAAEYTKGLTGNVESDWQLSAVTVIQLYKTAIPLPMIFRVWTTPLP